MEAPPFNPSPFVVTKAVRLQWDAQVRELMQAQQAVWRNASGIMLALTALPWLMTLVGTILATSPGSPPLPRLLQDPVLLLGGAACWWLITVYLHTGLLVGAIKHLRGGTFTYGDLFSGGRYYGRALCLTFLNSVLVLLTLPFLLLPGFMVHTLCYLALPLMVEQDLGVWESLRRSLPVARRHLWGLFPYAIAYPFMVIISMLVTSLVLMALGKHLLDLLPYYAAFLPAQRIGITANLSLRATVAYHGLYLELNGYAPPPTLDQPPAYYPPPYRPGTGEEPQSRGDAEGREEDAAVTRVVTGKE